MRELYGLIGFPVKHSYSALMHNAAFKHLGIDAEYKLFGVRPEELKGFFENFSSKGISGVNITIPYKTKSMYYMDDLNDEVKLVEAINTVVTRDNRLIGYNTDGAGFLRSLREDLDFNPKGKVVFIFGAGGAARAVCFSLAMKGVSRIILRDVDSVKAAAMARDIEKKTNTEAIAIESDRRAIKELIRSSDLLVNATPVGMKKEDPELVPGEFLHKTLKIFDLIYNPSQTPLLKEAKKRDIASVNGMGMLLYQGARSFELWTRKKAPIEVMRKAITC